MKKIFLVFLSFIIGTSFPSFSSIAFEIPEISASEVYCNGGDSIEVEIIMKNNPGVIAFSFDISYDTDLLELKDVKNCNSYNSFYATFGNDITAVPYRMCWDNISDKDSFENGIVAILVFDVAEIETSTKTNVNISLNQNSTFNSRFENVSFAINNGIININSDLSPEISISSVYGKSGETVDMKIVMKNNPGVACLALDICYDDKLLVLEKVSEGNKFKNLEACYGNDLTEVPYRICWDNHSENSYDNGEIAILSFSIIGEDKNIEAPVSMTIVQESTFNNDLCDVKFSTRNGRVIIGSDNVPELFATNNQGNAGDKVLVDIIINNNPGVSALSFDLFYDSNLLKLINVKDRELLSQSVATFGNDMSVVPYRLCWDDLNANHVGNGCLVTLEFEISKLTESSVADINLSLNQGSTFDMNFNNVFFLTLDGHIKIEEIETTAPSITTSTSKVTSTTTTTTSTSKVTSISTITTDNNTVTTTSGIIEIPPITTEPLYILGDVNEDGEVDSFDASKILAEYALEQTGGVATFTELQKKIADINNDGKVDPSDASKILFEYAMKQTGGKNVIVIR